MENMTCYIGLELDELIAVLDQAEADGISTKGLSPSQFLMRVQRTHNLSLVLISGVT